jgi:uncharacterized phage protein gp47/JayE
MTLRRRTFPEVLDNLLVAIVGGVAAEPHPFPPPAGTPPRHELEQPPAADVISVYGTRNRESHLFRKDVDYSLLSDGRAIEWRQGGQLPDPGTLVHVNYAPRAARAALNDLYAGSVVRTLAESAALEIARLYAQLQAVYESSFIDTATGRSLDNVVALLGIERVTGGRAAGEVELTRSPASRGAITILAGTRVMTADGAVEYEATATATMGEGQQRIRVPVRDLETNEPLSADALTVLPVPLEGIIGVTNPAPTVASTRDETDEELRERAKTFLHGSERGTVGALRGAIARQQILADVTEFLAERPGVIEVTPHVEALPPELRQRLLAAIENARPAGVLVELAEPQPPRKVDIDLRLETAPTLLEPDLRAIQAAVREKIEDYFARLPVRAEGSVNQLVGLVLSVPGVQNVWLLRATVAVDGTPTDVLRLEDGTLDISGYPTVLGELQIADPNLPTALDVAVTYPAQNAAPSAAAIQASLVEFVTSTNTANASEERTTDERTLDHSTLLALVPLPASQPEPYSVQFVFTAPSGLSRIVAQPSDRPYVLTPFERLALAPVQIEEAASA